MKWRGAICLMFVGCASRAHLPADETPSAVKGYNQVARLKTIFSIRPSG